MTRFDVVRQVFYVTVFAVYLMVALALLARAIVGTYWGEDSCWQTLTFVGASGGCGAVLDGALDHANKHIHEMELRKTWEEL